MLYIKPMIRRGKPVHAVISQTGYGRWIEGYRETETEARKLLEELEDAR